MQNPFLTGILALAFVCVHLFVGNLKGLATTPRSRWLSFAGGVAVAYVFMHMLPTLASHGGTFARTTALDETLAESTVYTLTLIGLVLFYGTERAVIISRGTQERQHRKRPSSGVFWLHVASSSLLIFVIAYLLNHREDASLWGLAIYAAAMLLHFTTADFGSRSHHPELYDRAGRWTLAGATVLGWLTGLVIELPMLAIGGLYAFVAGGIILTVLKEELPAERESRFAPFLLGAVLYGALVLGEEALVTAH